MATTRRLWVPVLVGLLVAVLFGPAGVTAVEPRTMTASIMIPAAAFVPDSNTIAHWNGGTYLTVSDQGYFVAPVIFPVREVSVRRITTYAVFNGLGSVRVVLFRSSIAAFTVTGMGTVLNMNTDGSQAVYTTEISPRKVNTALQAAVLGLEVNGPGASFRGVKITYTYETTP